MVYIVVCHFTACSNEIKMLGAVILFLCFVGCFCQGPNPQDSLQYVLNFDSPVYVCPDDVSAAFVDTSDISVSRHNESTAFLVGSINFLKGLDQKTMVIIQVEKEASGSYELVFSHEICDLCDEITNPDSDYHPYMKYCGVPDECPFDAGKYPIHNFILDTDNLPVNGNNAGRYQATINFYKNPGDCKKDLEFIACLKLDLVIELG